MNLPLDPAMLLSVVNTNLRDRYPSLEEFAAAEDVDISYIKKRWPRLIMYMIPRKTVSSKRRHHTSFCPVFGLFAGTSVPGAWRRDGASPH